MAEGEQRQPVGNRGAPRAMTLTKPTRIQRRPVVVALGVALIAVGALAMVSVTSSLGRTREVLAVTGTIHRGEVIRTQDVGVVDLPVGPTLLTPVGARSLDEVVGKVAATELLPGSLLTVDSYSEAVGPPPGRSIVGIALKPSQMPAHEPQAGDHVRIVTGASEGGAVSDAPATVSATVRAVVRVPDSGQSVVDVEVADADAPRLAAASAAGEVALVVDSPGA